MHPHWYHQDQRNRSFVDPYQLDPGRLTIARRLDEAYRYARAAQQNLEAAEFRFARETEQLHTTIAALEHSAKCEAERKTGVQAKVARLSSQLNQIRSAKTESDRRCEQLAAKLHELNSRDRQLGESLRAELSTKESEILRWKQKSLATQTRLEQKEQLLSESARSIDQLSNLVGILRTDHEYSELLVDDLDSLCSRLEMSQADVLKGLTENSVDRQANDQLVRRMNDYEVEREQYIQQLQLTESRLSDCQALLQREKENARQIATAAHHFEAEMTIEVSEMELQHANEVQELQDEIAVLTENSRTEKSDVNPVDPQSTQFHPDDAHPQYANEQELWTVEREQLHRQICTASTALESASNESCRLQETIDDLAQNVVSLQCQLGDSNELLDQRQQTINDLTSQIEELSIQNVSQQSELDRRAQYLAQQANQVASLQHELEQVSGIKRSRDLAMQNSQSQAQRASDLENQLAEANAEVTRLKAKLDSIDDRRAA